jgi:putative spermidine/putrescine transport system substrate-binding protein
MLKVINKEGKSMKSSKFLKAALFASMCSVSLASGANAEDLTISAWGGALQDVYREVYFKPFSAQSGVNILEDTYLGGWAQFEAMKQTGVIKWDVVEVETSELVRGCDDGTFLKLDWAKVANKTTFIPGAASDCGLGVIVVGVVPAYNAELVMTPPTKLEDFWDLKTWPGKRGMRAGPKHNLELALLAAGVPASKVYPVLSTPEGLNRAFAKLDQIKSQIQWWEAGDQAPSWLRSGDVAMAISYNARVSNANREGGQLKIVWDKFTYDMDSWVILAGSSKHDAAYRFLKFFAQPEPQIAFMERFAYGTPSVEAASKVSPKAAELLPVGTKMAGGLFAGSDEAMQFWLDNYDAVNKRWNAWAGAK